MKLENQVVSLELAKKLKELGVRQESFFKWGNVYIDGQYHWSLYVPPEYNKVPNPSLWVHGISAFTVAELGEMLPDFITEEHLYTYQQYRNWSDRKKPKHGVSYWFMGREELHFTDADTEADARAKMLVYLLENNLISLPA